MYKLVLCFLLLATSAISKADVTGAGDAAILAQLIEMYDQGVTKIKQLKESLDTAKSIEQYEKLKTVASLYEEGIELQEFYYEQVEMIEELEQYMDDPEAYFDDSKDVDRVLAMIKDLEGSALAQNSLSTIAMDMKRLVHLNRAQQESEQKIMTGTSRDDESKISATNLMIMSSILLDNEERVQKKAANETDVAASVLRGSGYSALATEK